MKYPITVIAVLCLISCRTKVQETLEVIKLDQPKKELFTLTQQYQIFCWTIKKHEGFSQKSYKCSANKNTIGWGFTGVKTIKDIHQADLIFQKIVLKLFKEVSTEYPKLTYLQKAAIVSLYYNTGSFKKIKESGFLKELNKQELAKASVKFKQWCKVKINHKTITIKGLKNRRSYEAKLLTNTFTMHDYEVLKQEIVKIYQQNRV